jgi:hypothetical protein
MKQSECGGIAYCPEIRCFSEGNVLQLFLSLLEGIIFVHIEKRPPVSHSEKCMLDMWSGFLDICGYLNGLNNKGNSIVQVSCKNQCLDLPNELIITIFHSQLLNNSICSI